MSPSNISQQDLFEKQNYNLGSLDDEIRADGLCGRLLKECYLHLVNHHQLSAEEASRLCYGAGYFLHEFLIPDRQVNLFDITPQLVRQFAGNWYIIKNLEPNLTELTDMLEGVLAFYDYCRHLDMISEHQLDGVRTSCSDLDYYQQRIDSFYAIENDGYFIWDAACPLKS